MKKIRVTVIHEFEMPDSWTVISREEDNGHFILRDGKLYRPSLEWWQLEERRTPLSGSWLWHC